ncbi:hypothetical protein F4775DRAFT_606548 [Biscogniauxia sp. FL1348]|nr:hypothetical protein F4775DRAFT_606548 [Biscogniauxia sp. FL1348]
MSFSLQSLLPTRLLSSLLSSTPTAKSPSLLLTALLLLAVPFLAYTAHCYRAWHALGGGGLPRSPRGWLANLALHPFARSDHRAARAPYADRLGALTGPYGASFFSFSFPTPPRAGPRPCVPTAVAPQRQTTQRGPAAARRAQDAYLAALARANPELFALRPSALEDPAYQALWLRGGDDNNQEEEELGKGEEGKGKKKKALRLPPWCVARAAGEFAHVHPEGSTHVVLSLVDAARAVERGWAERHRLSGVGGAAVWVLGLGKGKGEGERTVLPWGYVLIYAPRDADGEEMRVWRECVLASARFVAESAGAGPGEEVVAVPEV